MRRPPPRSTLFPYTTLFRSLETSLLVGLALHRVHEVADLVVQIDRGVVLGGAVRAVDVRGGGLRELRALPPRGDQTEVADVDVLVEVGIGGDRLEVNTENDRVEIRLPLTGPIGLRLER